MFNTSQRTLKNFAAFVWIIGGIILLIKGISLLGEAQAISSSISIIFSVLIIALITGIVKSKFIMMKFCRSNLLRINRIEQPKLHQFFENKFFFWLAIMILTGITLSRLAAGNYNCLLAIGGLDFSLSVALITSSAVFLEKKFQAKGN